MTEDRERKRPGGEAPPGLERDDAKARRDFARAIAKAEFGRFYFGEGAERALADARRKKPPKRTTPK